MDFITFVSNQGFLFWTFLFLACLFAYLLSVLKVILFDVRDTKLAYGPYCTNLKLLYKPLQTVFQRSFCNGMENNGSLYRSLYRFLLLPIWLIY